MKTLRLAAWIGGAVLVGIGGAMVATNPDPANYEKFATREVSQYLKQQVCPKAPKVLGFQEQCPTFVDANQPQIEKIISEGTQQQNFLFFSIYKTDLSVSSLLPTYHFETIGIFQNFHVYKAQRR